MNDPKTVSASMSRRALLKVGTAGVLAAGLGKLPLQAKPPGLGFCPISGSLGDTIRIFGPSFGGTLADISVKIVSGTSYAFLTPEAFDSGDVSTLITAIPPAMMDGQLQVVLGMGSFDYPMNLPAELGQLGPIRSWLGNGGARTTSFQDFQFPATGSYGCLSYWGGVSAGRLSVDVVVPFDENCCPVCPAGSHLTLRLCGATANNAFEFSYQATLVSNTALYTEHVVDALCTMMYSAFKSNYGTEMSCSQSMIDPTRVNLSVGSPDASPFVRGAIHVELDHNPDSIPCDSMDGDSVAKDSTGGSTPDSGACDSIGMSCDSISVDFIPFTFA